MAIRKFQFVLESLTPLLLHQDSVELGDELSEWRKSPDNANLSKAGDDRSPPWSWKTYAYTDGETIGVPSDNLMVSLRQAGAALVIKANKTFKAVTQSGLLVQEFHLPIELPNGKTIAAADVEAIEGTFKEQCEAAKSLGFMLFVKRAKIGSSKHVRVRPRFDKWTLRGTIEVAADEITDDVLSKLFEIAGSSKGLCDWRPSSPKAPGPFGRFKAKLKKA